MLAGQELLVLLVLLLLYSVASGVLGVLLQRRRDAATLAVGGVGEDQLSWRGKKKLSARCLF